MKTSRWENIAGSLILDLVRPKGLVSIRGFCLAVKYGRSINALVIRRRHF